MHYHLVHQLERLCPFEPSPYIRVVLNLDGLDVHMVKERLFETAGNSVHSLVYSPHLEISMDITVSSIPGYIDDVP